MSDENVRVTVLFDNYVYLDKTKAGWGFSCLIEKGEQTLLFDAGGDESIFLHNLECLGVRLDKIYMVVVCHLSTTEWSAGCWQNSHMQDAQVRIVAAILSPAAIRTQSTASYTPFLRQSQALKMEPQS